MQLVDEKTFVGFLQEASAIEHEDAMSDLLCRVRDAYGLQDVCLSLTGIAYSDLLLTVGTRSGEFIEQFSDGVSLMYHPIRKMVAKGAPVLWHKVSAQNDAEQFMLDTWFKQMGPQGISVPLSTSDESTSVLFFCPCPDEPKWTRSLPVLVRDFRQLGIIAHRKLLEIRGLSPPAIVLSDRHIDVLQLLATGMNEEQIAKFLGISERSVKQYISEAKVRLRSRSKVQAVAAAISQGYLKTF